MKHFKFFTVAVALFAAQFVMADPSEKIKERSRSVSVEIEKLLGHSGLIIEENFTVTVIFSLTEERTIEIYSVKTENEAVKQFILEKLEGKSLGNKNLKVAKYYELPVKVTGI